MLAESLARGGRLSMQTHQAPSVSPNKKQVLAFGAELSRRRYRLTLARYVAMAEAIRREASRKRGPLRILDLACGEGRLILYGSFPGVEFVGLDISRNSLEQARQRGYTGLLVHNACSALPFQKESFDLVVCSHILEHVPDPGELVSEVNRVLKPGGGFIVGVPITMWWTRLLRIYLVPLLNREKKADLLLARHLHVSFFTVPSLKILLHGFSIEDIRGFRFFSSRHLPLENWRWYYRLNTAWGKLFPRLTSEVNVIARKPV